MKDTTAIGEICKFAAFLTDFLYLCGAPVGEKQNSSYLSWNPVNRGKRERSRGIFEEIMGENFIFVRNLA